MGKHPRIPEYNDNEIIASAPLYQALQDLDIFVEGDRKEEKIIRQLFKRCIEGEWKIRQIFPVGNKHKVIEKCERDDGSRNCVYVVDGDFELLLGSNKRHHRLFVLPVYCIENLLIDETACVKVLDDHLQEIGDGPIKKKLMFADWVDQMEGLLDELFIELALSHHFNVNKYTLKKCYNYIRKNGEIDEEKTRRLIADIAKETVRKKGEAEYKNKKSEVCKRVFDFDHPRFLTVCSGKDFLLPLIQNRLESLINHGKAKRNRAKLQHYHLKLVFSKHCDVGSISNAFCNFVRSCSS